MGSLLATAAFTCPLCRHVTKTPVILECKHRFCQRCIGDLWSVCPSGPYKCPGWGCSTSYSTLPFDRSLLWPHKSSPKAPTSSNLDTSSHALNTDSPLRRSSIDSRPFGKRKASTPVLKEPDTKRPATCDISDDVQTPKHSSSDTAGQLRNGKATINGMNSESNEPACDYSGDDVTQHTSELSQHEEADRISTSDTDCRTEADLCDASLLATENHSLTKKPSSPANLQSFTTASTSQESVSPASKSITPMSTKHAAASPIKIRVFSEPEHRNTSLVPCHYCPKMVRQLAVKTCLVCGASMCAKHLRPHMESSVFQSHTLVPPTVDISFWKCDEHQELNRIYCRLCAVCVCTLCTAIGSHRNHVCISTRDAEMEIRDNLTEEIKQLVVAKQQVKGRMTELTRMKETAQALLSDSRAGVEEQYATILGALRQEEQAALQVVEEEESRVVEVLGKKLDNLQNSLQSIQQGLETLEALANSKGGHKLLKDQAFLFEYSKVAQLDTESCVDQLEAPEQVDEVRLKCLQKWTQKRVDNVVITELNKDRELYKLLYGTVPTLDADTAHPKLRLFDNRKVTYSEIQEDYTQQESRFSSFPQVLACHALEVGRWYWEVAVTADQGSWKVGVCEGLMERKSPTDSSHLGHNRSSWCLAYDRGKLEVLHNKVATPVIADKMQRVGVFLDFEEDTLTFFNVTPGGSLVLMHSYKHSFALPLYPALYVSKTRLAFCTLF
ncbi:tripartite motif-containing protein 14-like [Nerophis ophidion]|uniref:tripartite motif-containing protein 14-like n=1 Tax=Nerophis ophidion TaxID=159077 RepID=UPI002ADF9449|nr:tripartite motif-containing protein 14-like [Nerophis ophidion]